VITRSVRDTAAVLDAVSAPVPGEPHYAPGPRHGTFADAAARTTITLGADVRRAWIEEHCDREYHSMRVPADAPVVQLVMRAAQRVGTKVETVTIGGGSDANVYNKHDITSVNLGTGMRDIHTVNEWIDLPDFYRSAEIVLECVKERAAA